MKINQFLFAIGVLAICAAPAMAGPTLIYDEAPVRDATVDSLDSTIRGGEGELMIQGFASGPYSLDSKKRTYLMFDLTRIPDNAVIETAVFGIYFSRGNDAGGSTMDPSASLYLAEDKVGGVTWDEMTITWGSEPGNAGGNIDSVIGMPVPDYYEWNLLSDLGMDEWSVVEQESDLQDNFLSLMLAISNEDENNSAMFNSSEALNNQPYLKIEYAVPVPAPGALMLGSLGVSFVGWLKRRRTL